MTEEEVEAVLQAMPADEAQCIREQRAALTRRGITREPMRTRMACEFAEVLLAGRDAKRKNDG